MKKKEKQFFFRRSITAGDEACEISEKKKRCTLARLFFNIKPELGLILGMMLF